MRFDGFVLAVDPHPEPPPRRIWWRAGRGGEAPDYGVRSGLAFSVLTAPRVNAPAWFALAVAAPSALLAAAAAITMAGLAQAAGVCAALLLVPGILLALRAVEVRRYRPAEPADAELTRAFCLTTGQACGLLFVVMLGAPFSGQSVAVGLAMAAVPLAIGLASHVARGLIRTAQAPQAEGRDWLGEWAQAERLRSGPAEPPRGDIVPFPQRSVATEAAAAEAPPAAASPPVRKRAAAHG